MLNKTNLSIMVISVFLLSNCGLYSLGVFGSCNTWEIYSEKRRITKIFKLHVCSTNFNYSFHYLSSKKLNEIQNIVYPKLKKMIENQAILASCSINKEDIIYQYGIAKTPIEVEVICKNDIRLETQKGRFFMTSFPY